MWAGHHLSLHVTVFTEVKTPNSRFQVLTFTSILFICSPVLEKMFEKCNMSKMSYSALYTTILRCSTAVEAEMYLSQKRIQKLVVLVSPIHYYTLSFSLFCTPWKFSGITSGHDFMGLILKTSCPRWDEEQILWWKIKSSRDGNRFCSAFVSSVKITEKKNHPIYSFKWLCSVRREDKKPRPAGVRGLGLASCISRKDHYFQFEWN